MPTETQQWMEVAELIVRYMTERYGGNPMYDSTWPPAIAKILAAHAPQQWIPVSERLPEAEDTDQILVVVWNRATEESEHALFIRLSRTSYCFCDFMKTDITSVVTDWMYPPAPPVPETPEWPDREYSNKFEPWPTESVPETPCAQPEHIPDECVQGRMVGHSVHKCPACLAECCDACGEWPYNGCDHNRIHSAQCEHVQPCAAAPSVPPGED